MKNTLIVLLAFALLGIGVATAHAGEALSIGVHLGVPYYQEPPAYYAMADESMWWNTPVEIIEINGEPHRMHMWNGHWYDEAWSHNHSQSAVDIGVRDNDHNHGGRRW